MSMITRPLTVLCVGVLLLGLPRDLFAQDPAVTCAVPSLSDPSSLQGTALLRIFPDSAAEHLAGLLADSMWAQAVDSIALWFDASVPDSYVTQKASMRAELAGLGAILRGTRRSTLRDAADVMNPSLNYAPVTDVNDSVSLFPTKPTRIDISSSMPLNVQRGFCWAARSAVIVLDDFKRTEFRALRQRISTALERWTAYNDEGRSQYPWELLINGLSIDKLSLDPPRTQWIVLHPWVGLQAVAENGDWKANSVGRAAVVPVDILGFVRYRENFSGYWGLSLTATLSDTRTRGGVAAHFGEGISIGPMFSDGDGFDGVLFTLDFLKTLTGVPYVQEWAEDRLGGAVEEAANE